MVWEGGREGGVVVLGAWRLCRVNGRRRRRARGWGEEEGEEEESCRRLPQRGWVIVLRCCGEEGRYDGGRWRGGREGGKEEVDEIVYVQCVTFLREVEDKQVMKNHLKRTDARTGVRARERRRGRGNAEGNKQKRKNKRQSHNSIL